MGVWGNILCFAGITLPQRPPNVNVPAAFSPNNTSSEQAIKSLSSFEENKAGPFSRRERYYEEMEKNGSYKFHYIQNDGKRQSLIWWDIPFFCALQEYEQFLFTKSRGIKTTHQGILIHMRGHVFLHFLRDHSRVIRLKKLTPALIFF